MSIPDIATLVVASRQSQMTILTFTGAITGIVAAAVINANVSTKLESPGEIERILFINNHMLRTLIPSLLFFAGLLYAGESLQIYQIQAVDKCDLQAVLTIILHISPILVLTCFAVRSMDIADSYSEKINSWVDSNKSQQSS